MQNIYNEVIDSLKKEELQTVLLYKTKLHQWKVHEHLSPPLSQLIIGSMISTYFDKFMG